MAGPFLLEDAFCVTRTPGYLLLELTNTRCRREESVHYTSRIEKLFHELCNTSTKRKPTEEAIAIQHYIREITLTPYIDGLPLRIHGIIKPRNLSNIEETIKKV